MKQIAIQVRNSSNVAITGLTTSDFSVRTFPYGSGEAISGLTATEIGSQGNYVISGFTTWYEDVKVFADTGSGLAEQTWIGVQDVGDLTEAFVMLTGTQTIAGDKTFSSVVSCSTAASSSNHLMRYNETVRTSGNQTGIAGTKVVTGSWSYSPSTFSITGDGQFTSKKYVDDLFAGSAGVVQSSQKIKLVPSRTTEDAYSRTTLAGCLSALDTSSSKRGNILIESMNIAGNTYSLSDDENWVADRIDITGENMPKIDVTASSGNSVTADARLNHIYLYNSGSTNWTFVNFTFENCILYFNGNLTLTSCNFRGVNGIRLPNTKTLTISNSTGVGQIVYNDDIPTVTISGTQCRDIASINVSNLGI